MASRPKILVVSRSFPRTPEDVHGTFKRLDVWVEALSAVGDLSFLFYVPNPVSESQEGLADHRRRLEARWRVPLSLQLSTFEERTSSSRWEAYGPPLLSLERQKLYRELCTPSQVASLRRALSAEIDLVFAHRLSAMSPMLRLDGDVPPILFDLDDIEHLARFRRLREQPRWPGKYLEYLQLPALWWGERRAIRMARRTFVCSPEDERYLRRQGLANVSVIPNSVAVRESYPDPSGRRLLYLGVYSYDPNLHAARALALDIWPRVRARVPDARLMLAGSGGELLGERVAAEEGVEVTGFVEDLDHLYEMASVVCCPIRAGGGTRIKIIEAAAYGRPVVATSTGAEGLEFREEAEILIRDSTEGLADACVALLLDEDLRRRIGNAAREACRKRYERDRVIDRMRRLVSGELDLRRGRERSMPT